MAKSRGLEYRKFWPYFLLPAVIILFYWDIFWAKGAWLVADHAEQHFPWACYLAESLKQFRLPFWTDLIHTGFPITAEGQIGSFYLPNLLFYSFLPIRLGYAWNILFHLVVSALAMCAYLRALGVENRSIFFGVLVYLFGSTLGGAYYNITSLKVLSWFPLTLLICDQILKSKRMQWDKILVLGVVFSLALLAGYLQFAAYSILFTGLYLFLRFFDLAQRKLTDLITYLLHYVWAVLIAALIAAPQIALTFELAIRSNRAAPAEGFAYVGSYSPLAVICLLFPSLEGFFSSKLYLGIFPVFFMLASLYGFKQTKNRAVYFLVLIALLLALGQFSPLYVGLVKLFHFHSFRTPVKFIFFTGFFLSVLSAFGMQAVLGDSKKLWTAKAARAYGILLLSLFFGVLAAYLAFQKLEAPLYKIGRWLVERYIYGQPGHPFAWDHYEAKLAGMMAFGRSVLDPRTPVIWLPLLKMAGAILGIAAFLKGYLRAQAFYGFVILMLVLDLGLSYSDIRGDYQDYASFFKKNKTTEFLEKNLNGSAYFTYSANPQDSPLPAAKNMIWGIRSANAYSPLVLKRYYEFMGAMGGVNDSVGYHPLDDAYFTANLPLLGMLNVKYILSNKALNTPQLQPVEQEGAWTIYQNLAWFPPYAVLEHFETYQDIEALRTRMQQPSFRPLEVVLFEDAPVFYGKYDGPVTAGNEVKIGKETGEEKHLSVICARNCIVLLPQVYFPGWEAEVDAAPARLYRVNGVLSAIPLNAGKHEVSLHYQPLLNLPDRMRQDSRE